MREQLSQNAPIQRYVQRSDSDRKEQGGRSLNPPPFQLSAQPIQRQVVDEDNQPAEWEDVENYIEEQGVDTNLSMKRIGELFEEAMNSKVKLTVEEFVKQYVKKKSKKRKDIDEPCDEEKKFKTVKRDTAPKHIREYVYDKSDENRYYIGKNKKGHEEFECGICNKTLALDSNGKEVNYSSPNSKTKKQPPVCHGKKFPAAHVKFAIEEIITSEKRDPTLLSVNKETDKLVKSLIWQVGLDEMFPGHLKCNSKDKDKQWKQLDKKTKKEKIDGVREYLTTHDKDGEEIEDKKKKSKRRKIEPTILDELCNSLDNFKRKKDDKDPNGGGKGKSLVTVNSRRRNKN